MRGLVVWLLLPALLSACAVASGGSETSRPSPSDAPTLAPVVVVQNQAQVACQQYAQGQGSASGPAYMDCMRYYYVDHGTPPPIPWYCGNAGCGPTMQDADPNQP